MLIHIHLLNGKVYLPFSVFYSLDNVTVISVPYPKALWCHNFKKINIEVIYWFFMSLSRLKLDTVIKGVIFKTGARSKWVL